MDLLTQLLALYHAGPTVAILDRFDAAVHQGASNTPVLLGLCALAGIAAAAAVLQYLRPAPEAGQVWIARRRDLRGIRVRITDAGPLSTAVVLTPPPGPLASELVGMPVLLPARGNRIPGYRLLTESA